MCFAYKPYECPGCAKSRRSYSKAMTMFTGPYGGGVRWVRTNPPSGTCGKQKSEPNHFVAVQELIEGSELEASLKRLEVPSYALYHRTVLHFVMTSLGDCYPLLRQQHWIRVDTNLFL